MKKFVLASVLMLAVASIFSVAFAQEYDPEEEEITETTVKIVNIEDTFKDLHPSAKNVTLTMEYMPYSNEVRLHYICMTAVFDRGEAMNTAMAYFEKFGVENKFKHYAYREKDRTKYFNDSRNIRMTEYVTYVVFSK